MTNIAAMSKFGFRYAQTHAVGRLCCGLLSKEEIIGIHVCTITKQDNTSRVCIYEDLVRSFCTIHSCLFNECNSISLRAMDGLQPAISGFARDKVGPLEDNAENMITQGVFMAQELNMHFSSVFMREDTSSLPVPEKSSMDLRRKCWGS